MQETLSDEIKCASTNNRKSINYFSSIDVSNICFLLIILVLIPFAHPFELLLHPGKPILQTTVVPDGQGDQQQHHTSNKDSNDDHDDIGVLGLQLDLLRLDQDGDGDLAHRLHVAVEQHLLILDVAASGSVELHQDLILGIRAVFGELAVQLWRGLLDLNQDQLIGRNHHHGIEDIAGPDLQGQYIHTVTDSE